MVERMARSLATIIVSAVLVVVSQIAGDAVNHNCRNSGRCH